MKKIRSDCPVSFSLDVFGDKWTLLVVRDMMLREKYSYSEFLESEEKIATNILVDRLSLLEKEGIVTKKISPKNKSKNIYCLTQKGIDLLPIIIEMIKWGAKYNADTPQKDIIVKLKEDSDGLIKNYRKKLEANLKE